MKLEITIELPKQCSPGVEQFLKERLPSALKHDIELLALASVPELSDEKPQCEVQVVVLR
jgi:hypothetical protein